MDGLAQEAVQNDGEGELLHVLSELCPDLLLETLEVTVASNRDLLGRTLRESPRRQDDASSRERLRCARVLDIGSHAGDVDWSRLVEVTPLSPTVADEGRPDQLDVNSGGDVFLCLFRDDGQTDASVCVLKCGSCRSEMQAEIFAGELGRYLDLCVPQSRLIRKQDAAKTGQEWLAAAEALTKLRDDNAAYAAACVEELPCFLLMEYIPAQPLPTNAAVLNTASRMQSASPAGQELRRLCEDLGRVLALDMLLGNPDRLPVERLGWRGNLGNVLFGGERSNYPGRLVAIDACFPRQPPPFQVDHENRTLPGTAEIVRNDVDVCAEILNGILGSGQNNPADHVESFQSGFRAALDKLVRLEGVCEMMCGALREILAVFIEDLEKESPSYIAKGRSFSDIVASASPISVLATKTTPEKIKVIIKRSKENERVNEKLKYWKDRMLERGQDLKEAVEDWQSRHGATGVFMRGFLEGTHPITDTHETKLRLEHMLRRLRILEAASRTARPPRILDAVYIGNALSAQSHHTLRHLSITHVINATQDVELPPISEGFHSVRIPLRDGEAQNATSCFYEAHGLMERIRTDGGAALVHCYEGRSRSVALVLAHIILSLHLSLKDALELVKAKHPKARPNAVFLRALSDLEVERLGSRSTVPTAGLKPRAKTCHLCGEAVGVSSESLASHILHKHDKNQSS